MQGRQAQRVTFGREVTSSYRFGGPTDELGSGSIHGHENGIEEQHQADRVAVLNG